MHFAVSNKSGNAIQDARDSNAVARAQEDVNTAVRNGDANVADAQNEVNIARQKLANYYNSRDFTDGEEDTSTEQALLDDIRAKQEQYIRDSF